MGRRSNSKQKLLAVTFELIWENSYGGVSLDEICERAKVQKGSFHYFFRTKENLVVAACEAYWINKQAEMDRLFSSQLAPLERLSQLCHYVYQLQKAKYKNYSHVCGCPIVSIGVELATQQEKIRIKAEELISRIIRYLESAIADAKRDGLVAVENPKASAQQVYSFVTGTVLQAKIQNDIEMLSRLEPTMMAIIGARTPTIKTIQKAGKQHEQN
jgi:TetR/AcrR family transcriptional repressor of nem operon